VKKLLFFCSVFLVITTGLIFSQTADNWKWGGMVRYKPVNTIVSLANGGFEFVTDWIPYITPNIGIPIEIDLGTAGGVKILGIMTGFEAVPFRHKEKSGLYFTVLGGLFLVEDLYMGFIAKADIGYQLVTNGGFVFTPAIGIKYSAGISFDLMVDVGVAYERSKKRRNRT
jgi:hypothetical protein